MITLYAFGPNFGLPDPSPFCMKAEMLLKLAGLPYRKDFSGFRKAPKGKQPYIEDDGLVVADSTFIRDHIERKYGVDLDKGLTPAERALGWALEKMCEDHLYWMIVISRWLDDENFAKGPSRFFDQAPAPVRPFIRSMVRRKIRGTVHGHGLGRHSPAELTLLAKRDIEALAVAVGEKPYVFGATPSGTDATIFAFVAAALCAHFETDVRRAALAHANLIAYRDRMMRAYFPEFSKADAAPLHLRKVA